MPTISIDIPAASATRALDGFCKFHGYSDTLTQMDGSTIPNPETKLAFAKRMLAQYIKRCVLNSEREQVVDTAVQTLNTDIDALGIS